MDDDIKDIIMGCSKEERSLDCSSRKGKIIRVKYETRERQPSIIHLWCPGDTKSKEELIKELKDEKKPIFTDAVITKLEDEEGCKTIEIDPDESMYVSLDDV